MVTDPPYGIELDSEWRDRAGLNGCGPAEASYMKKRTTGHTETTISGDTRADWSDAFALIPSLEAAYVYLGGVKDTRVVDRWIQGGTEPYRDADRRIRLAYQIAKTLSEHDSVRVVQAWFTGLNPELQDRVPVRLLKEEDIEKVGPDLLNAMRAFLAGG